MQRNKSFTIFDAMTLRIIALHRIDNPAFAALKLLPKFET